MQIKLILGLLVLLGTAGIVYAQEDYSAIDQHAISAPSEVSNSVEALTKYLVEPAKNDTEKVRAIHKWITENISYDVEALESGDYGKQSVPEVLKSKKGVCSEYSSVFGALATQAGLEAVTVIGFSKGPGFGSDSVAPDADHAWNAVKADGEWYLLDCTWAAGYVDASSKFVRKAFDHYFMTPPDQFIYDHLPEVSKWQLLDTPINRKQFENMVYLRPGFFHNKLRVVSNDKRDIMSDGSVKLTFGGPSDAQLNAEVSRGRDRDSSCQTFVQKDGNNLNVSTIIPKTGRYTLRLYAKRGDSDNRFEWAADYSVNVTSEGAKEKSMPTAFSTFYEKNAVLHEPMSGSLKSGTTEKFQIAAPGAESVNVVVGGQWIPLKKNDGLFEGEVDIKGDVVQLVAKYPDNESSYVLLKYKVK